MLQPEQLRIVARSYPAEIAELRSFIASSGIATETAGAVAAAVTRLGTDRSFHRDFASHILVIVHRRQQEATYADLLGVIALAAAGSSFATAAEEKDAHDLLRFLMAGHPALEQKMIHAEAAAADEAHQDSSPVVAVHRIRHNAPVRLLRRDRYAMIPAVSQGIRARTFVAFGVLSAIVAGVAFTHLYGRHQPVPLIATVTGTFPPQKSGPPPDSTPTESAPRISISVEHSKATVVRWPAANPLPPAAPGRGRSDAIAARMSSAALTPPNSVLADIRGPASPGPTSTSTAADTRAATVRPPSGMGSLGAISSTVLSQRLGARPLPPDYAMEDRSYNARYPRLLRRHPLAPLQSEDSADLIARNEPLLLLSPAGGGLSMTTVVRPVSLGIMAANVLYSPAPAYPAAAAAARVQGEVKVQAEIDRDGNVASARVISGPALLRDAAVDAVQRWRYRPYLAAGKPVAMSATAVVDFELQ